MKQPHFLRPSGPSEISGHPRRLDEQETLEQPEGREEQPTVVESLELPSVSQLRKMMMSQPPLSPQRVQELLQRIQSGAYLTREAAETSAQRLRDEAEFDS